MSDYFDRVNNNVVLDVLKEIGNIGAGNAATALAKMINKKVDMTVPKVNIMDFATVPEMLGGEETEVCGIFFKIEGDMDGTIMFVLSSVSAHTLINLLMPGMGTGEFDDFSLSALQEIGNILSGSYISSLSMLTGLNIQISIPSLAVDMAGAILSVPAIQFGLIGDKILIIENDFIEEMGGESVQGYFFLIPDIDSYEIMFKSLGIEI
ncbi:MULTISPECIES: chemotaxis protein CheC [unclassified Fusibacter]|uniref:chemotaxis protein CheC n=1 Tax=unclassified Fusibacter TaxID=2624464 RepID=UPI0010109AB5|nr:MULTISPECIES: chemotaxis protein CheC [unclassified Fusibacter]MCK8058783.1 chemotaxis protein CheC [Fusibacter sp. A2]NPE21857.1 chemotaxis protein CheC [Fusibacter sp. A1]RXV61429.1 chemotaxis protein CheC [Fusibacter sp. A1]